MKNFPTAALTILSLALGVSVALPPTAPASAQSATTQVAVKEQTQSFAIENMYYAGCPITVRKAMEKVSGVKSVKVDFEAKTATVVYDPSIATVGAIAAASTNAGYPAKAIGN